jgi:hypothetical protein
MSDRGWIIDHLGAAAFEQLASGLAGNELHSVLHEVMQRRAGARVAKDLLEQYRRDPFCAPAAVDLRAMNAVEAQLLAAASRFEALELSPVAPLGACSVVALTRQHRVLSALRATEVVSDPTNVLALECALRLRAEPARAVHLATSQRVVRAQPIPKLPGYAQHFRLFALGSGGLEAKDHAFTVDTLLLHVRTMLEALDRLQRVGYDFGTPRVEILATPERRALADRIVHALGPPAIGKPLDHAYYSGGLRFQVWVTAPDGTELPLVDGGTFDWLAKLASSRRAVYVATGIGAQLIAQRFRAAPGGRTSRPG